MYVNWVLGLVYLSTERNGSFANTFSTNVKNWFRVQTPYHNHKLWLPQIYTEFICSKRKIKIHIQSYDNKNNIRIIIIKFLNLLSILFG